MKLAPPMTRPRSRIAAAIPFVLCALAPAAHADWPPNGFGVCTEPGGQHSPALAPDGAGGAYVVWAGGGRVQVQRVTSDGAHAPGWPAIGIAISPPSTVLTLSQQVTAADGSGGAFVAWGSSAGTRLQHVTQGGIAAGWPVEGLLLASPAPYGFANVVSDGFGGAIVGSSGSNFANSFVQRVTGNGSIVPGWPAEGVAVSASGGPFSVPSVAPDGAGGAFAVWTNFADSITISAQRIAADGVRAPGWPANGVVIGAWLLDTGSIAADGKGGAYIVWSDYRDMAKTERNVYLQRVTETGLAGGEWPVSGLPVCVATGDQQASSLAADGTGGVIVCWLDLRSDPDGDLYAQRLTGAAAVAPGWPADGAVVSAAAKPTPPLGVVPDGTGGAFFSWSDARDLATTGQNIYVQRLLADGAVAGGWPDGGIALCEAAGDQIYPHLVTNGAGGAIVVWDDAREGSTNRDIYAARINADGSTPALATLVSADATIERVRVHWFIAEGAGSQATLERRTAADDWREIASLTADGTGHVRYEDRDVAPGVRYGYRLGMRAPAGEDRLGEVWITVPAALALSMNAASPSAGPIRVWLTLPDGGPASLELYDVRGARLLGQAVDAGAGGARVLDLATRRPLRAGVHVVRLVHGDRSVTAKAIVVR